MLVFETRSPSVPCLGFARETGHLLCGTGAAEVIEIPPFGSPVVSCIGHETQVIALAALPTRIVAGTRQYWGIVENLSLKEVARAHVVEMAYWERGIVAVGIGYPGAEGAGTVELWDLSGSAKRLQPVYKEPRGIRAVAAQEGQHLLAWSSSGRRVNFVDPRRQTIHTTTVTSMCTSLAFHPEGHHLAAAQDRGAVVLDIAKKHPAFEVKGHTGRVTSVAYHPGGKVLATGSWDGTVRLWEAHTGKPLTSLKGPTGRIYCLAYDSDGLRLAAGGDAGNVVVWDAD